MQEKKKRKKKEKQFITLENIHIFNYLSLSIYKNHHTKHIQNRKWMSETEYRKGGTEDNFEGDWQIHIFSNKWCG